MVKEYLEQIRDGFLEDRIKLSDKELKLQNKLKENIKFIQLLEENSDPNYAAFTPREVNRHNVRLIGELKVDQKEITQSLEEVRQSLSDLNCKIDEINSVIKVAKEDSMTYSDLEDHYGSDFRIALLTTQENERQRIARDLHDSTIQGLTSLIHKSELCMKLQDVDPIRCKLELATLNKNIRTIIEELRNMIYDLRPMSFDDIGLDITIEQYIDKLKKTTSVLFDYKVEGQSFPLSDIVSLSILRLIQEGCVNSIKHSNATKVQVRFLYMKDSVELFIQDDGDGFDVSTLDVSRENTSGFGISMMKERVYLLSGTIDIESELGEGCSVHIVIPVHREDK